MIKSGIGKREGYSGLKSEMNRGRVWIPDMFII